MPFVRIFFGFNFICGKISSVADFKVLKLNFMAGYLNFFVYEICGSNKCV